MQLLTVAEARKKGPLIEIKMRDQHRSIGAGNQIVVYLGHTKGDLYVLDWFDVKVKISDRLYKFIGMPGKEIEVKETGEIMVKEDKKWKNLGRLFGENPPKSKKAKKKPKKKAKKKPKKKATKTKKKPKYSGGVF